MFVFIIFVTFALIKFYIKIQISKNIKQREMFLYILSIFYWMMTTTKNFHYLVYVYDLVVKTLVKYNRFRLVKFSLKSYSILVL